jgi:EAL domain-containing protein (putative c-di-GMP-specific phosphodiesterase class I)
VRDIGASYIRREMARALKLFADKMGSTIIAEGIEHEDELRALLDLGIEHGQGFLLGRPAEGFGPAAIADVAAPLRALGPRGDA